MCVVAQGYCKHIPHRVCKRVWSPLLNQALGCCPLPWSLSSCPLHKVMLAQQQTVAQDLRGSGTQPAAVALGRSQQPLLFMTFDSVPENLA